MTDNVTPFPKSKKKVPATAKQEPPPFQGLLPQEPPPGIIMCLEDMLVKARAGELTSLMVVAASLDPRIAVYISGSGLGFDTYNMLGGLARATQRLTKILDEREVAVQREAVKQEAPVEPPCDVEPNGGNDGYNGA